MLLKEYKLSYYFKNNPIIYSVVYSIVYSQQKSSIIYMDNNSENINIMNNNTLYNNDNSINIDVSNKGFLDNLTNNINLFVTDVGKNISDGIDFIKSIKIDEIKNEISNGINIIDIILNDNIQTLLNNVSDKYINLCVNLYQDEKTYIYEIELPGVSINMIAVDEHQGFLRIFGQKKLKRYENIHNYVIINSATGIFNKIICLPNDADRESIICKSWEGLLSIIVSKKQIINQ